jgi:hypothetical protein
MSDEMMPSAVALNKNDSLDFPLTGQERRLVSNFRAMKRSVQESFLDISEEFALALPGAHH